MLEASKMYLSFSQPCNHRSGEASPLFHLRRGGVLEIKQISAAVPNCGISSMHNKVMIALEVDWGADKGNLTTKSASSFDGHSAFFDEASNFMQFAGPEEMPGNATIKAIVKEKGMKNDEKDSWFSRMGQGLAAGVMLVEEAAMGRKGLGVPRAHTEEVALASLLGSKVDAEGFVEVQLRITKLATGPLSALGYGKAADSGDCVKFRLRWLNFENMKKTWTGSEKLWKGRGTATHHFNCKNDKTAVYEPLGARELLRIERCEEILNTWAQYYGDDPLYDDTGDSRPPIQKVRAIHGVNIPTEVAYALRVHTIRLKESKILTRLILDDQATLKDSTEFSVQGGVVHATPNGLSGDGVVPLSSLDRCRQWAKAGLFECELSYLPGVEHRAILADQHFHQTIKDAVVVRDGLACMDGPARSFSIAGTFSAWKPRKMTWDGFHFVYVVSIGQTGWESFQILEGGSWERVLYPDMKDANPSLPHSILGPDNKNAGKDWTIGKNRGKLLEGTIRFGSAFKVKLEISGGTPASVTWDPFTQVQVLHAKGVWQVDLGGGKWLDFPSEGSARVNSALELGHSFLDLKIEEQNYKLDLLNMLQENVSTKKQRRIRQI
ncbi:unnamed protein product [Durusdinium trenchii]|uniref:WWE domain-containing protein n=1 Tax=Durusdinium trenchii TaxID=1381693 RepID=A0ABP0JIZ7_9DINO